MEMELEMEEQMEQEQVQKTNGVFLFIYFTSPPFTRQVFKIEGITCDKCVRLITEVDISKS